MKNTGNVWRAIAAVLGVAIVASLLVVVFGRLLSLPFRDTNDLLHQQEAPITLDVFIPAGTYIDPQMSIGQVMRLRFGTPQNSWARAVGKIAHTIPTRYRILSTAMLYLFWTTATFALLRIVTWMRYGTALASAFLAGAFVYYFMPDLLMGKLDDFSFIGWALFFAIALRWSRKKRKRE